jgi:hypothetical protein
VSVSSLPIVSVDGVPSKAPEVPSASAPMPHPEPKRAETAQGHATGVAEHVRVRLERKTSGRRGPFNHPGEAGRRERGACSLTKAKGDVSISRWSRRRARSLSPRSGWVLGVPFLTRRTEDGRALRLDLNAGRPR